MHHHQYHTLCRRPGCVCEMKHTHKNQNGDVQIEHTTISKMVAFDLQIWGLNLALYQDYMTESTYAMDLWVCAWVVKLHM